MCWHWLCNDFLLFALRNLTEKLTNLNSFLGVTHAVLEFFAYWYYARTCRIIHTAVQIIIAQSTFRHKANSSVSNNAGYIRHWGGVLIVTSKPAYKTQLTILRSTKNAGTHPLTRQTNGIYSCQLVQISRWHENGLLLFCHWNTAFLWAQ